MKITFKDGEENIPVIEEEQDWKNSVFKNQYTLAQQIFNTLKEDEIARKYNNIVSFCGDRGTGKTSCMMSFKKQCEIENPDCCFLKEIDPSFFDDTHNIIELTVGNMYSVLTSAQSNDNYNEEVRDNLVCQFNKVMIYMKYLAKPEDKEHYYDGLQELEALSVGMSLQESIEKLIGLFLEYVKKEFLVITIDDLDLNIQGAYLMSEHIRKYLTNGKSIILLGVKVEQLIDAVQRNLEHIQQVDSKESHDMAVKYVTKLIPVSSRINMPLLEDYCDYELSYTYKNVNGNSQTDEYHSVKEAVTHSIFWRTGYLFYNSQGRSSQVVPKSLRSLRQLVHMLYGMPLHDKNSPETHKQNQRQFKQYFFNTWTQQLTEQYRIIAHKLVEIESDIAFNKAVIANLMTLPLLHDNAQLRSITDTANYTYNISLGDVMRILEYLSQDESDIQLQLLLFFIRSLYSMKMYENYDFITDVENFNTNLYPNPNNLEQAGEIYSSDVLFDTSNKLQKLINGQYFSFAPNEVLPPQNIDGAGSQSRDCKLINGDVLIGEIKHLGETRNGIDEEYKNKFQLIEFFILSISRAANIKSKSESLDLKRNTFEPSYLLSFNPSVRNLVYDILAPFYNVLNLKITYNKFDSCFRQDEADESLYDFAESQEWSLLKKLLKSNDREYNDIHGFLSDSVIRNAEVLRALTERIKSARFDRYSGNNKDCIKEFYKKIRNTGMSTYPKQKDERPYQIQFMFLDAVCNVLSVCDQETFDAIYGRRQDVEDIYAAIFTARDYATSTILGHIRTGFPNVYSKLSSREWKNLFHAGERYTREQIIAIIEDVKNR